jgi:surface antigen-like variable number repeat protein
MPLLPAFSLMQANAKLVWRHASAYSFCNMACRATLVLGLLAANCGLVWSLQSWAQSSTVLPNCSSPATENAKSQTNADGNGQNSDGTDKPHRKVIVDRIEFDQPVHLSISEVDQIIKEANEMEMDADSLGWVDNLAEIQLRSAWQDQGYFKIAIDPHAQSIGGDSEDERFLVLVRILNEGPQFHLGSIRFVDGTAFSDDELRHAIPLREGEIFSVKQVRAGMEALTKLYGARGYIDFTVAPDTEVNDDLQRIDLVLKLDEQKQYRVGSFEIRGLDPTLEARMRSVAVPGEAINMETITAFFKDNRSVLPPRALDNLEIRRNVRTGIADLTFDVRTCR